MKIKCVCILVIALFFIPVIGGNGAYQNKILMKDIDCNSIPLILGDEELDQEQEYSDSSFKIYGNYWAAQSFKPAANKISKIRIMLNKTEKKVFLIRYSVIWKNVVLQKTSVI